MLAALPFSKKIDSTGLHTPRDFALIELLETKNSNEFQNILRNINNNENTVIGLPFLQSLERESLVGITESFL